MFLPLARLSFTGSASLTSGPGRDLKIIYAAETVAGVAFDST